MDEAKAREQSKWIRLKMEGVITIRLSEEKEVETIIAEAIYRAYHKGYTEARSQAMNLAYGWNSAQAVEIGDAIGNIESEP